MPLIAILIFVVVLDVLFLLYGYKIKARLERSMTPAANKEAMEAMIARILAIAQTLFSCFLVYFITGFVGIVHNLLLTGVFIYGPDESEYKVFGYTIAWEIESLILVATLAWTVKDARSQSTQKEKKKAFQAAGGDRYEPLLPIDTQAASCTLVRKASFELIGSDH